MVPVLPISPAALTPDERARIRYHLGYPNVQAFATFALGTPASSEALFAIEGAFDKVIPEALPNIRQLIARCDEAEQERYDNLGNLIVSKVCDIELRPDAMSALQLEYDRRRNALANELGVYCNPYDKRDNAGPGLNCPVY